MVKKKNFVVLFTLHLCVFNLCFVTLIHVNLFIHLFICLFDLWIFLKVYFNELICVQSNLDLIPPGLISTLLRSGQVRSEWLTCTFGASCCSARLSRAQVSDFAGSSVRDRTFFY